MTPGIQLTNNGNPDLTPSFSPDGKEIVFHASCPNNLQQIFVMNANASNARPCDMPPTNARALTSLSSPPGGNLFAKWGRIAVGRDPQ